MVNMEVLYPFGGHRRGELVEVPADKAGALRRLHWAREIEAGPPPAAAPKPKVRRVKAVEKEPDIDADQTTETE